MSRGHMSNTKYCKFTTTFSCSVIEQFNTYVIGGRDDGAFSANFISTLLKSKCCWSFISNIHFCFYLWDQSKVMNCWHNSWLKYFPKKNHVSKAPGQSFLFMEDNLQSNWGSQQAKIEWNFLRRVIPMIVYKYFIYFTYKCCWNVSCSDHIDMS